MDPLHLLSEVRVLMLWERSAPVSSESHLG